MIDLSTVQAADCNCNRQGESANAAAPVHPLATQPSAERKDCRRRLSRTAVRVAVSLDSVVDQCGGGHSKLKWDSETSLLVLKCLANVANVKYAHIGELASVASGLNKCACLILLRKAAASLTHRL